VQATPEPEPLVPAVPIRKSVTPDYIISLEDGRKFKSLKRHLQGTYGMTPDEYRAKWGLPRDYPMVAPNYAKARSDLAKKMGLGRKTSAPAVETASEEAGEARRPRRARAGR
jgi:predicted transcriptional regulator